MTVPATAYSDFVASRTKELGTPKMNLLHAAVGVSGEAGELLDVCKKMWVYEQSIGTLNKEGKSHYTNLLEELGDVMFYVQMMCNHLGVDLEEAVALNKEKLMKRYPQGYSDADAAARKDKE